MNNLYGYAMTNFLPTSWFKWIDDNEYPLAPDQKRNAVWVSIKDFRFIEYSYW